MSDPAADRQHWDAVYARRAATEVSWYAPRLERSLALIGACHLPDGARVIDVGGGASTLVDDLVGRYRMTVLDLAAQALATSQQRLGARAGDVDWCVADVREADLPAAGFDLWHDRAVLHFLTAPADAARYAAQAARSVAPGGHLILAGFAPDGPERCSGLVVARRGVADLDALFGADFERLQSDTEMHRTPGGSGQAFLWTRWRRR